MFNELFMKRAARHGKGTLRQILSAQWTSGRSVPIAQIRFSERRAEGWNVHNTPDEVPAALAAARKFDLPGVVPMLTMPVLVATGDHDPNLASSKDLVKRAPDAGLVILENVGHGSVMQRPDLAADVFLEFQASLAD